MDPHSLSIVIAGGGTAGHIEPALAVGEDLRAHYGARVTALGTTKGLERDIIPQRGFDLELVTPVPIPRKLSKQTFALPFTISKSVRETRRVLKKAKADAVFGTGGYVAASAYLAARSLGIPFFVLETNALSGIANKLGVRMGGTGFNAHADSGMPGEVVGIPVRPGMGADPNGTVAARAREKWGLDADRPTIVVTGGSQGAQSINKAVAGAAPELTENYQILHAYGKKNEAPAAHEHYVAVPYIDDMAGALAVADLMVCRSGAMTVAEVTAAGVPAIYVPLPHGNGEQALNCKDVVAAGAARQIDDADLTPERLRAAVEDILGDADTFRAMRDAAAHNEAGEAAAVIASRIVQAVRGDAEDAKDTDDKGACK